MKRAEVAQVLRTNSCPTYLQHIILAMWDEIRGLNTDLNAMSQVQDKMAHVLQMISKVSLNIEEEKSRKASKDGVSLDSVPIEPGPDGTLGT